MRDRWTARTTLHLWHSTTQALSLSPRSSLVMAKLLLLLLLSKRINNVDKSGRQEHEKLYHTVAAKTSSVCIQKSLENMTGPSVAMCEPDDRPAGHQSYKQ